MIVLILVLASLPVEALLVLYTGHRVLEWSAELGACQLAPSSLTFKYCGSFWSVNGSWLAASVVIPIGWVFALLLRLRKRRAEA